ncbi:MAG: hypothetical protein Q4A44_02570 [Bacteroidales bacterium]|nr:hypothetical protein [Bacteroidales bacterium]
MSHQWPCLPCPMPIKVRHLGYNLGQNMLYFYRNWTLPLAIVAGSVAYLMLKHIQAFQPYHSALFALSEWSMPSLIFTMLLLTFSRVAPSDLRLRSWQWPLIAVQALLATTVVAVVHAMGLKGESLALAQGLLVCFVAPTATAATVIVSKLSTSSDAGAVSVHVLLQGVVVSALIALLFPSVTQSTHLSSWLLSWQLMIQVARLLLLPLSLAWLIRYTYSRLHSALYKRSGWSFYLWSIALALVTVKTLHLMATAPTHSLLLAHAGMALVACMLNFGIGRLIGKRYGAGLAAGQALGQKNTIFAIWLAYAYLLPTASFVPGAYVIWQNTFNAWQLWRERKARV